MTLQELLAQIVGPGAPEPPRSIVRQREPMPTAPQRYAGQRGALQRDPIPAWASDPGMVERVQQRGAFDRANRAPEPPSYLIGPGAVGAPVDTPPPMPAPRAPVGALSGDRPALGNASDWIAPPPPLPSGPFARRDPVDAEPWRAPVAALGIPVGGAAPRRGLQPPDAPSEALRGSLSVAGARPLGGEVIDGEAFGASTVTDPRAGIVPPDDLDAAWSAALARVQGRTGSGPSKLIGEMQRYVDRDRAHAEERARIAAEVRRRAAAAGVHPQVTAPPLQQGPGLRLPRNARH